MGLTGTLHRISAIRDRDGSVVGLTYRIGRHVAGMSRSLMVSCTDAFTDVNGLQHACHHAWLAEIMVQILWRLCLHNMPLPLQIQHFNLCCSTATYGACHAGVGNLLWDILETLGQSSKDNETSDVSASSMLLLGHPGVGQPPCPFAQVNSTCTQVASTCTHKHPQVALLG